VINAPRKTEACLSIAGLAAGLLLAAAARAGEEQLSLAALEAELLSKNPSIRSAESLAAAEEHRADAVAWIDDPVFTYGYFGESIQTRVGPQQQVFNLSQKLPLGGQLSLQGEMAEKMAAAARAQAAAVRWETLTKLRTAYFDLWWVEQALLVADAETEVLDNLQEIAQAKYAAGKTERRNVLDTQLARSRLEERRLLLQQRRLSLAAMINQMLDRPPASPLGRAEEISFASLDLSLDGLVETAREKNPRLIAQRYISERAKTGLLLARREYVPNLTLGVQYFQIGNGETASPDDGQDAWMVTAGINLPIWFGKNRSTIGESAGRLQAAQDDYRRAVAAADFEVKDAYFKLIAARRQIELHETNLLPQARQAAEATRVDYETGRADFSVFLNREMSILEVRLSYLTAIANYRKSLAQLANAVGEEPRTANSSETDFPGRQIQ